MKRKKVKIDWTVLAVEVSDDVILLNTPDYNAKHNYKNVAAFCNKGDKYIVAEMINTYCRMQLEGEKFSHDCIHCIDSPDGKTEMKFELNDAVLSMFPYEYECVLLTPLFHIDRKV